MVRNSSGGLSEGILKFFFEHWLLFHSLSTNHSRTKKALCSRNEPVLCSLITDNLAKNHYHISSGTFITFLVKCAQILYLSEPIQTFSFTHAAAGFQMFFVVVIFNITS